MFLFEQFLRTKPTLPQSRQMGAKPDEFIDYDEEADLGDELDQSGTDDPTSSELVPIKRYFLIEKLRNLQSKLKLYNLSDSQLDLVLKFVDDLSYKSLLKLAVNIVQHIGEKVNNVSRQKEG